MSSGSLLVGTCHPTVLLTPPDRPPWHFCDALLVKPVDPRLRPCVPLSLLLRTPDACLSQPLSSTPPPTGDPRLQPKPRYSRSLSGLGLVPVLGGPFPNPPDHLGALLQIRPCTLRVPPAVWILGLIQLCCWPGAPGARAGLVCPFPEPGGGSHLERVPLCPTWAPLPARHRPSR